MDSCENLVARALFTKKAPWSVACTGTSTNGLTPTKCHVLMSLQCVILNFAHDFQVYMLIFALNLEAWTQKGATRPLSVTMAHTSGHLKALLNLYVGVGKKKPI